MTYLKSVCKQLQEITQLTTFTALIKLSTIQPGTMFPDLIQEKYHQFTPSQ